MSLTVAGIDFEDHEYDERGDVLYLSVTGYRGLRASLCEPRGSRRRVPRLRQRDRADARQRPVAARPRRRADDHVAGGTRPGGRTRGGAGSWRMKVRGRASSNQAVTWSQASGNPVAMLAGDHSASSQRRVRDGAYDQALGRDRTLP